MSVVLEGTGFVKVSFDTGLKLCIMGISGCGGFIMPIRLEMSNMGGFIARAPLLDEFTCSLTTGLGGGWWFCCVAAAAVPMDFIRLLMMSGVLFGDVLEVGQRVEHGIGQMEHECAAC